MGKPSRKVRVFQNRFNEFLREREELEKEIVNLKKEKLDSCRKVRELEQSNDDLERAQRMISESISAVESALNSAIERNAILESEIDEKENLKERVQRLTDEARGKCSLFNFALTLSILIFLYITSILIICIKYQSKNTRLFLHKDHSILWTAYLSTKLVTRIP